MTDRPHQTGSGRRPHVVFVEMSMTGAGERCLDYARERGYRVTLVTRSAANHGAAADRGCQVVECATDEPAALLDAVRSVAARHPIDGVTTTHDLYVPQAALVAETLGLPGMPAWAAAGVRNKYRMRQRLQDEQPHLNPPFRLVRTEREALDAAAEWGFPVVAKPQDANDSQQVCRLDSVAALTEYVRRARSWDTATFGHPVRAGVLLEKYLDGTEHSIETVQHSGGELQVMAVTAKELLGGEEGHFAEAGVSLPVSGPLVDLLSAEVSRALTTLGVDVGVVHTECRVQHGRVRVLEVNPRLVGDMTGSHMIELALGASAVQQVVETALGNPVPWRPSRRRGAASYGVCLPATGRFDGVDNLAEVTTLPGVDTVRVTAPVGALCHAPPRSNLDFVARVVTVADTPDEAMRAAKSAANAVRVRRRDR